MHTIHRLLILFYIFSFIPLSACARAGSQKNDGTKVSIRTTWRGLVRGQKKGSPTGPWDFSPLVIRNRTQYAAFVVRIPRRRVTKGPRRKEKSNDPLLKKPAIDFTRHMLLVVMDGNWYNKLAVMDMNRSGSKLQVRYRVTQTRGSLMGQRPLGTGVYLACLVPRVRGRVTFKRSFSPLRNSR